MSSFVAHGWKYLFFLLLVFEFWRSLKSYMLGAYLTLSLNAVNSIAVLAVWTHLSAAPFTHE